ncbi:MAG: hypothetical protein AAFW46_09965, partial [Pseudomonadota bacterium]
GPSTPGENSDTSPTASVRPSFNTRANVTYAIPPRRSDGATLALPPARAATPPPIGFSQPARPAPIQPDRSVATRVRPTPPRPIRGKPPGRGR